MNAVARIRRRVGGVIGPGLLDYQPSSHTRMPTLDQLWPIAMPKIRNKPLPELSELKKSDVRDFGEAEFFPSDELGKYGSCG